MPNEFGDTAVNEFGDRPVMQAASPVAKPETPGYWQELWQQSGIPGLIKGIKEHPAETVANAIGGLFAPLNPNFTQSPQGQAMKENLTRSPQSAGAALTLGGLAAVPAIRAMEVPEAASAAIKAAAPGVASGAAKLAAGEALGHLVGEVPGLGLVSRVVLDYPGARDIYKALGKGGKAFGEYYNPPAETAAEGVTARPVAPPPIAPKTPGQVFYEAGKAPNDPTWESLSKANKKAFEQTAKALGPAAAETTPQRPTPSGAPAAQPVSAAPPERPAPVANVVPIRPEPAPASSAAPAEAVPAPVAVEPAKPEIPFEVMRKTGPQDALEGVGGGVGPGFNVYRVPTGSMVPAEDISGMPEKMADVAKYAEQLKAGSEPPALFGHYDPETGHVVVTSGSRRLMAAQQAGADSLPVAIPKAAPGAEEALAAPTRPVVESPRSIYNAAGELKSPELRAAEIKAYRATNKSVRYADAITKWAQNHGISPETIAEGWEISSPETRGRIILQMQRKGYLGANETIPKTSAQGIIEELKSRVPQRPTVH